MNGAEAVIATAISEGVEVCFANPGTTEMPLVGALDSVPGIRGILCLQENAATGAADGYARMAGKPAMTLLHLGPGMMNGLSNLHNARRAHTPVFNVIGEHASWHVRSDPPLNTDIEAVARTVGDYVKENLGATTLAVDTADAIAASYEQGGRISTLVVPHDAQMEEAGDTIPARRNAEPKSFSSGNVIASAKALKAGKAAMLLNHAALSEDGLKLAARIAEKTGAKLIADFFFSRMERGGGLPTPGKLPYFPEEAIEMTKQFDAMVLAGTRQPVAFFGYPDGPSKLTADEQTVTLAGPGDDILGALQALADELDAPAEVAPTRGDLPLIKKGALTPENFSAAMTNLIPENAILMDEGLTSATPFFPVSHHANRFTHLMLTGGAIGMGPGAATGAAVACPDRKVINMQADGSGAYAVQALWTQAREQLDVVTVIASNRRYHILGYELMRAGIKNPGRTASDMCSLGNPDINWVSIAEGFGVEGQVATTAEELIDAMEDALSRPGPRLIEAVMA